MESAYQFALLSLLISDVCLFQRDFEVPRHHGVDLWIQTLDSLYEVFGEFPTRKVTTSNQRYLFDC